MKYSSALVVVFILASVNAAPTPPSTQEIHEYLRCASFVLDELATEFEYKNIWSQYRSPYLDTVFDFEECIQQPPELVEQCHYSKYAYTEKILSRFYGSLAESSIVAKEVVPNVVVRTCSGRA